MRRTLKRFWTMKSEVREYFLLHAQNPTARERDVLQTIEILANGSALADRLSLDDVKSLAELVANPSKLPANVRKGIRSYLSNKGTRGWDSPDRKIIPQAWHIAKVRNPKHK